MVGTITKLCQNTRKFDIDRGDNPREYVYAEDSPELAQFFTDVRTYCMEKIKKDPELFYPQDVEKLQRQEWMIRRFMTHHKGDKLDLEDPKKTADVVIKMMMWKKKMKLREMEPTAYPMEFFQIGIYGQAIMKSGEFLIHCNAGVYKKESILTPHIKELILCMMERVDDELDGRRVVIFADMSGVPLRHADIGIIYFLTLVALNYYRRIVKRCIIYEAPWYMSPFISLILAISPRYKALLTKVDRHNLFDVLDPEDIPESLGGKLRTTFPPPEGCPSGREYAKRRGIPEKDLSKCLKLYGFKVGDADDSRENEKIENNKLDEKMTNLTIEDSIYQ